MSARGHGSQLLQRDEAAIVDGADGLRVERLGSDPGDDAGLGQAAHVFETAHEQRLAEPLAAMRDVGAGGAEPAEALVVAVGGGEGDRRAVEPRGVHGAARAVGGARDLERPHRRELLRDPRRAAPLDPSTSTRRSS